MLRRIVVLADARVDDRPLALQSVYYPSLLGAYARAVGSAGKLIAVVAEQLLPQVRAHLETEDLPRNLELAAHMPAPQQDDVMINLADVYIPRDLKSLLRGESVRPVWSIREPGDVSRAAATLERHDMYVLARYLVIPVAKRLAHALRPTAVSPNQVTTLSCLFGVAAAIWPLVLHSWYGRVLAALSVHISITLDFTDGYLARLRSTDSSLGYWFDTMMDEVVKFALFLMLAALVAQSQNAWLFGASVLVLLLYHVLTCNHWLSKSLERGDLTVSSAAVPRWRSGWVGIAQRIYERLSYLDVHLYLVALALIARAEAILIVMFAALYAFRFCRMLQVRFSVHAAT